MKTRYLVTLSFLSLFFFASCEKQPFREVQELTIKQGDHHATPRTFRISNDTETVYNFTFSTGSNYNLENANQCDWNKLTGWSFTPLTGNHENAVMVAWRYDLAGSILLAPYYHVDETVIKADYSCTRYSNPPRNNIPVTSVQIGETFTVTMLRGDDYTTTIIKTPGDEIQHTQRFESATGKVRLISPWFGGDEAAPADITIYRTLIFYR